MHLIDIREFVLPNGVQVERQKNVDDETFAKWLLIKELGIEVQFEFLTTGHGSFTLADLKEEEDVGIVVDYPKTPQEANAMLKRLIMDFNIEDYKAKKARPMGEGEEEGDEDPPHRFDQEDDRDGLDV